MYERIDLQDGSLVGVHIKDHITLHENQQLVDLILGRARDHGSVLLLVIYDANPGLMGAEDLYDNMRFAKQVSEKIAKMAVIGKHDWQNTWIGLFGLFGGIQAEYFDRTQVETAIAWLKE